MRRISWLLCLSFASLVQASDVRNPFITSGPLCEEALSALDGWRLRGVMFSAAGQIALMQQGKRSAVRIRPGTMLTPEVMIKTVSVSRVTAAFCSLCDGAHYHWYFSGGKDAQESDPYPGSHDVAERPGEPSGDPGR